MLNFKPDNETLDFINNINRPSYDGADRKCLDAMLYKLYSDVRFFVDKYTQIGLVCDDDSDMRYITDILIKLDFNVGIGYCSFEHPKTKSDIYLFVGDEILRRPSSYSFERLYFNLCGITHSDDEQLHIVKSMITETFGSMDLANVFGITPELLHDATK